jgi:hypothetical protein
MIAQACISVRFSILPLVNRVEDDQAKLYMRNLKLCTPSDVDHSPYFDITRYRLLDFHHHTDHRLVPWQVADGLMGQEKAMYVTADLDLTSLQDYTP